MTEITRDVVIVGAGAAGLTTANELKKAGRSKAKLVAISDPTGKAPKPKRAVLKWKAPKLPTSTSVPAVLPRKEGQVPVDLHVTKIGPPWHRHRGRSKSYVVLFFLSFFFTFGLGAPVIFYINRVREG